MVGIKQVHVSRIQFLDHDGRSASADDDRFRTGCGRTALQLADARLGLLHKRASQHRDWHDTRLGCRRRGVMLSRREQDGRNTTKDRSGYARFTTRAHESGLNTANRRGILIS